jgi:ankyrin repeat protein
MVRLTALIFALFLASTALIPPTSADTGAPPELGDIQKIKKLIRANPNWVRSKDASGWTPLHLQAANGCVEAVKLLIQHGAPINAKDIAGNTPLHLAARYGFVNVVKVLIASGADVNAKDANGMTPLQIASKMGHQAVVDLLRKQSSK